MTDDQFDNSPSRPLTPLQQQVVELRSQGLTFRAIAEMLGRDVSNVHRAYQRGMANLERKAKAVDPEALLAKWNKHVESKGPITDKSLLADIDAIIDLVAFFLHENKVALAKTSPKDLVGMLDKLVEKRQLLKGEPTAITRFEDIRKLDDALEALYAEAKRRGLKPGDDAIDVTPEKLKPNGSGKNDGE